MEKLKKKSEIDKKEYYIIDKAILPDSIQKVIEVDELIRMKNISAFEATKQIGISRGTYYKYKDYIKPFYEENKHTVFSLYLSLEDKPGVISRVLDIVAENNMNILTIIQNIPVNGIAMATLSIQTSESLQKGIAKMLENIGVMDGVRDIRVIGNS